MESITECDTDLFADTLPSLDDLKRLAEHVYSSEKKMLDFRHTLHENIARTDPSGCLAVAIALCILGSDAQAVEKLQKGTDCKHKFVYLGRALRRLGRCDQANQSFQKSLDCGHDALSVSLEKAATYRSAGRLGEAAEQLNACTNFKNVSAEYHYQLGRLREQEGLYDEAVENYLKAFELDPHNTQAIFRLAYRCDLGGDEEAAIDYYNQVASETPTHISALLNLAVLYEDRGEFDEAARCVDMVLESHPNHPRAILFKKDIDSSKTMYFDEEIEKKRDVRMQILETPLSDFELSVRSRNCFRKMGIHTLGDLVATTETELLAYKNFGETSLQEIKVILDSKSLHLGITLEQEQPATDDETMGEQESAEKAILNRPVDDLNLSVRSRKCVERLNLRTIGELTKKTEAELLGVKNFGVTSLNEIKKALESFGLTLRSLD